METRATDANKNRQGKTTWLCTCTWGRDPRSSLHQIAGGRVPSGVGVGVGLPVEHTGDERGKESRDLRGEGVKSRNLVARAGCQSQPSGTTRGERHLARPHSRAAERVAWWIRTGAGCFPWPISRFESAAWNMTNSQGMSNTQSMPSSFT